MDKFERLFQVLKSETFLKKLSLGGEIPFYISTYRPEDENKVSVSITLLKKKLETHGIDVFMINLYDLCLDILCEEDDLEDFFQLEEQLSQSEFLEELSSALNAETAIIPEIENRINQSNARIVFITGVGQVYPFLRSHTVINNLQRIVKDVPVVMFYPGDYDGQKLSLFGRLKNENYYRAFNIDEIRI
ncbi:MAG: DUF1788 domain-containing protein [Saprospiraceae bacterium]|nr:DUF1788 domain-containing protein [Saprospiraceae bacterium]